MSNSERILTNNQIIKDNNDDLAIILDKINKIPPPLDTSDATATASDILKDKTAYVKGEKITGTYEGGEGEFNAYIDEDLMKDPITSQDLVGNSYLINRLITKLPDTLYTTGLRTMGYMFSNFTNLKKIPQIDTSAVTNVSYAFNNCSSLTEYPNFDYSLVTNSGSFLYGCKSIIEIDNLNFPLSTNTSSICYGCKNLTRIGNVNFPKTTSLYDSFYNCENLEEINFENIEKVTNIYEVFRNCKKLKKINNLNTATLTNVTSAFTHCESLEIIPAIDISGATSLSSLFEYCPKLKTIEGELDCTKATSVTNMFSYCNELENVKIKNLNASGLVLTQSPKLSHESLLYLLNNLKTITTSKTITIGNTNLQKLTLEERAIATNKRMDFEIRGCLK